MTEVPSDKKATLRLAATNAMPGPYYTSFDDAADCPDHANSGLAMVDTGRADDWPIARLCEWPTASFIAACAPETIIALLDENDRLRAALGPVRRAGFLRGAEHAAQQCVISAQAARVRVGCGSNCYDTPEEVNNAALFVETAVKEAAAAIRSAANKETHGPCSACGDGDTAQQYHQH